MTFFSQTDIRKKSTLNPEKGQADQTTSESATPTFCTAEKLDNSFSQDTNAFKTNVSVIHTAKELSSSINPKDMQSTHRAQKSNDKFSQKSPINVYQELSNVDKYDIGHTLKKLKTQKLSDSDLKLILTNRWRPVEKGEFPYSECKRGKGKIGQRFLNNNHFIEFEWLALSNFEEPDIKGLWCVYCTFFKISDCGGGRGAEVGKGGGQKMGNLVNKPLINFNDLTGKEGSLTAHNANHFHKTCKLRAENFIQRTKPGAQKDVRSLVEVQCTKEALQNRSILKSIVETVLLCARQNIAFRGNLECGPICTDGSEPEHNDGNFRALLRYRLKGGDTILKQHLETAKRNSMYISNTIQDELINISGKLVLESVAKDVNNCKYWSILGDETQDRAKREQLVIVVRYIAEDDKGEYQILEEPIKVIDLFKDIRSNNTTEGFEDDEVKLSGKSIAESVKRACQSIGLNFHYLIGQGYDGAAAMASERVGVVANIKQIAPRADYIHCVMHSLNLSATQTSKVLEIRNCLDVLKTMCNFFKYAKRHSFLMNIIQENAEDVRKRKLVSLCPTRFVERHESVLVAKDLLPYIVLCLSKMETWDTEDTRSAAGALLSSIQKPGFLIGLIMLEMISALMKPVSASLQTVGKDLVLALAEIELMHNLIKDLRQYDSKKFAEKVFQPTIELAEKVGVHRFIVEIKPRTTGLSLYRANAGPQDQTASDYYRINVFYPLLDSVIADIDARFGPHQNATFLLSKLLPCNLSNTTWEDFEPALEKYSMYLESASTVKGEFLFWKQKFLDYKPIFKDGKKEKPSAIKALNMCDADIFPNITILLKILCALPVSTAEPERFFSKLEKTLTSLRSTMGEERLESLIMLQVHRTRTPSVEDVINSFAEVGPRRLNFNL